MADAVRNQTDKELAKMEKHLASIFAEAEKDLIKKANDYLSKFEKLDEDKKSKVEEGKLTQKEYDEWRKNKLLYGEHWTRLISAVQNEMVNCNKTAIDYVNGKTAEIFAMNYNSIAEKIEESDVKGYSFEMVDAETVRQLATSGELMLPHKDLDEEKDKRWNAKQVNSQILQGVLQGESIPKIAQRMANVCNNDKVAMVRTARTMITGAENSGRQAGMNKAADDGIIFWKMWIATSDERTRDSHNVLNGQVIPNDEKFVTINEEELEFPGDWRADGCEVYNCRCSLGSIIKGFNKKRLDEAIEEQQNEPEVEDQQEEISDESWEPIEIDTESLNEYVGHNLGDALSESDVEEITKMLAENPTEAQLLMQHKNIKFKNQDKGEYSPKQNEVRYTTNKDGRDKYGMLFHEFGHALDFNINVGDYSTSEMDILKKYIDNFMSYNRVSMSDEFLSAIRADKSEILDYIKSHSSSENYIYFRGIGEGVQDFISGIYGKKGGLKDWVSYGHPEDYWQRTYTSIEESGNLSSLKSDLKNMGFDVGSKSKIIEHMKDYMISAEAFANLNSAYTNGGKNLESIKQLMPNSYAKFVEMAEREARNGK